MPPLRILLAPEESDEFSKLVSHLKDQADLAIEASRTIDGVLERLRENHFDALISGIYLREDESGLKLLEQVRQANPLLPFFFYTRESSPEIIDQAFQAGAHDYFAVEGTPPRIEQIIESVRVNVELSRLLRAQHAGGMRSAFEEKYAGLFEELEEGSLMVAADTGVISYVNESFASSLGRAVEEMAGKPLNDFIVSRNKDKPATSSALIEQIESGARVVETVMHHRDGSSLTFWTQARILELSGSRVMLCHCRDITRFEKMERDVIAARNQLRTIVENSADAIIVAREDGVIEFIGGAAPQLFGVSPEDQSLKTLDDLFAGQAREVKRMLEQFGGSSRVTGLESSIVSRWGTRVPVSVAITALPSSDGVIRYLFNILDITAQKVAEAENLLAAELIRIVSTDAGPVEALPKLIEGVSGTVPLDFGLVVSVDSERDTLSVVALYSQAPATSLRVGQSFSMAHQPAEEELWRREGIIRNNLQEKALAPLERLLFKEGVRSYVSVPLTEKGKLIGAAHFGSNSSYALNRGHLALFRELAGALSGALIRAQNVGDALSYRLFTASLADEISNPLLLCDVEGTILEANAPAGEIVGADIELRGREIGKVLRAFFPKLVPDVSWLRASAGSQRPMTDRSGGRWLVAVKEIGQGGMLAGYSILLRGT